MRARTSYECCIEAVLKKPGEFKHTLPPLRVAFKYLFPPTGSEVSVLDGLFVQRPSLVPMSRNRQTIDPFALRLAFQHVDSARSLLDFLGICGPFRDDLHVRGVREQKISWEEFKAWQQFFKALLLAGSNLQPPAIPIPHDSFERIKEQPLVEFKLSKKNEPFIEIQCATTLEILGASLFLDRYRRARFLPCKLDGCMGTVEEGKREYCRDTCKETAKKRRQREDKGRTNAKAAK